MFRNASRSRTSYLPFRQVSWLRAGFVRRTTLLSHFQKRRFCTPKAESSALSFPCAKCNRNPFHVVNHMDFQIPNDYNWDAPSHVNYAHKGSKASEFVRFEASKSLLDSNYHCHYSAQREAKVHNTIIDYYVNVPVTRLFGRRTVATGSEERITESSQREENDEVKEECSPWLLCTAGPMGAGKTHTMRRLGAAQQFPLSSFVHVSPDCIKRVLPEYAHYLDNDVANVGAMLRREAGYLCEVICWQLMARGTNVWLDTSLREKAFFHDFFQQIRNHKDKQHNGYRIALVHVMCPDEDVVFERASKRALITKRQVPDSDIRDSILRAKAAVSELKPMVDTVIEIDNSADDCIEHFPDAITDSPSHSLPPVAALDSTDSSQSFQVPMALWPPLDDTRIDFESGTVEPTLHSIQYNFLNGVHSEKSLVQLKPEWPEFQRIWCGEPWLQTAEL